MNKQYKIQMVLKPNQEIIDKFYRNRLYDSIDEAEIDVAYYKNCDKRTEKELRKNFPEKYDTEFGDLVVEYKIVPKEDDDFDPYIQKLTRPSKIENLINIILGKKIERVIKNDKI